MRRSSLLLTAAPLLLLAACSGNEPAPEPTDNVVEELDVTNEAEAVPEAPTPTPTPSATPTPEETAAPVPDDEQVQADAEAAGMTARVSRDEAPASADDEQPVEERKQRSFRPIVIPAEAGGRKVHLIEGACPDDRLIRRYHEIEGRGTEGEAPLGEIIYRNLTV